MSKKYPISVMSKAAALALVIGVVSSPVVHAAQGDYYDLNSKKIFKATDLKERDNIKLLMNSLKDSKVLYEIRNNQFINYKQANDAISSGETIKNIMNGDKYTLKNIEQYGLKEFKQVSDDKKVKSIKAIVNQKLKCEKDQQIEFLINDKKANLKELKEAGYTVTFKYNKTGEEYKANGIVNGKNVAKKFEYKVEVIKDKEKFNTDWAEVEVVDATKAVKVNKVALVDATNNETEWKQAVLTNKVTFVAAEYENSLGEKNTDKENQFKGEEPKVESAKSSDITTAYYDAKTKNIVVLKDGKVTFDVKFADIKETVKVEITVKADQKATGIKTEASKVEAGKESTVKFTVVDKDGEVYLKDQATVQFTTKAGKEVESAVREVNLNKGEGSFKHTFVKGETVVTVYADIEKKEKLGSFTINAVDTKGNPDQYTLALAEKQKAELDLNVAAKQVEVKLDAKAFVDGVEVKLPDDKDFKIVAKSSNENIQAQLNDNVVTVNVTNPNKVKAGDKADIQLVIAEGAKETKVGDVVTVEVKNSTFQVTSMTLKADTKVKVVKDAEQEALKNAVVVAIKESEGEEGKKVTADMIDNVTYVSSNDAVIAKVKAINGGKIFVLDAKYVEDATLIKAVFAEAKKDKVEKVSAKPATGEINVQEVMKDSSKVVIGTRTFIYDSNATENTGTKEGLKYKDAAGLVTLINEDEEARKVVSAKLVNDKIVLTTTNKSKEANETQVTYNKSSVLFKGGENAESATLTLTFSEKVESNGNLLIKVEGKNATNSGVEVNNETVKVKLAEEATIAENDTIKEIKGLKTAKGEIVIPTKGVKITK